MIAREIRLPRSFRKIPTTTTNEGIEVRPLKAIDRAGFRFRERSLEVQRFALGFRAAKPKGLSGQILHCDLSVLTKSRRPRDDIAQFADISGPFAQRQTLQGFVGNRDGLFRSRQLVQKMSDEDRDVRRSSS